MARPRCSFVIGWTGEQTVRGRGSGTPRIGTETLSRRVLSRLAWRRLSAYLARNRLLRCQKVGFPSPGLDELVPSGFGVEARLRRNSRLDCAETTTVGRAFRRSR